jgi:hypothetical protein
MRANWTSSFVSLGMRPNPAINRTRRFMSSTWLAPVRRVSAGGPLSTWRWSDWAHEDDRSFVYYEGAGHDVPVRPGVTTGVRDGVLSDAGWGTRFTPRPSGQYKLKVTVATSDPEASRFRVTVAAKGGGWK